MTDTADAAGTARQCIELAEAGSELVRITVNLPEAAAAVPEIKQRMLDAGCTAPLIGDFHYNGHQLLTRYPACASALDKYRINPGNVGTGRRRDEQFATICKVAIDHDRPVRIGVNGGSLNQELVLARMQENTDRDLGLTSEEILNECMVISAVESIVPLPLMSSMTRSPERARVIDASRDSRLRPSLREALNPPVCVVVSALPVVNTAPASAVAFHSTTASGFSGLAASGLTNSNLGSPATATAGAARTMATSRLWRRDMRHLRLDGSH